MNQFELLPNGIKRSCWELSRMADDGIIRPYPCSVSLRLANHCDISQRTAKRHLRLLLASGWLERLPGRLAWYRCYFVTKPESGA